MHAVHLGTHQEGEESYCMVDVDLPAANGWVAGYEQAVHAEVAKADADDGVGGGSDSVYWGWARWVRAELVCEEEGLQAQANNGKGVNRGWKPAITQSQRVHLVQTTRCTGCFLGWSLKLL